jgi:hypothetical protein
MKLETYQITIDEYLDRLNYAVIRSEGSTKLIQLKNLKLVQIELSADNRYVIQEVTQGKTGECWGDISLETVIEHIQMLEGGNDTFAKIWHVDDVLSINSELSREQARLVLTMAMDNHDANCGINWEVLQQYVDQVLEMVAAGIII